MSRVAQAFEKANLLSEAQFEAKRLASELEQAQMVLDAMRLTYNAKVADFARETRRVGVLVDALREIRAVHRVASDYRGYETLNIISAAASEAGVTL